MNAMEEKSPMDICGICGKRREKAGVLIFYKGRFLCDTCIEDQNKRILKEFEEGKIKDGVPRESDQDEPGEAGAVDEEFEDDANSWPLNPLDLDRLDNMVRRNSEVPWIEDLSKEEIDPEAVNLIPKALAEQYTLIPIRREEQSLVVAFSDPADEEAIQELRYFTNLDIIVNSADEFDIEDAIEKYYPDF
jgi:hypothetical protein